MQKLEYLFSPIRIGAMEVKNRLVMAPMGTNLGNQQGEPTSAMIHYYRARSRRGVGLILTDDTIIPPSATSRLTI